MHRSTADPDVTPAYRTHSAAVCAVPKTRRQDGRIGLLERYNALTVRAGPGRRPRLCLLPFFYLRDELGLPAQLCYFLCQECHDASVSFSDREKSVFGGFLKIILLHPYNPHESGAVGPLLMRNCRTFASPYNPYESRAVGM